MISETVYNIRNKLNRYKSHKTDAVQHNNPSDDFSDITVLKDIQYYNGPGYVPHKHCYDIYYKPEILNTDEKIPIVFSIHGGGYQRGDKSSRWRGSPVIGSTLARHNYIVVATNYRLAPHSPIAIFVRSWIFPIIFCPIVYKLCNTFTSYYYKFVAILLLSQYIYFFIYDYKNRVVHPNFFDDSVVALKHVIDNIKQTIPNADTESIYLHGHSAGAHMASLLATDQSYLKNAAINVKHIKGVLAVSGIFDVANPIGTRFGNFGFYVGYASSAFGLFPSLYNSISPVTYVHRDTPPHLIINAASDMGLENCGKRMYDKLKHCNVKSYLYVVPNTSHSTIASLLDKHDAHKHIINFIQECQTMQAATNGHSNGR